MGRIDNTKLYYICGGLIIGLGMFFALLLSSKTGGFLSPNQDNGVAVYKTASGGMVVTSEAPVSRWKKIKNSKNKFMVQHHNSDYRPSSSYANASLPMHEDNNPLIASAKFLRKKHDKLKKSKKASLAHKSDSDKGRGHTPLSETISSSSRTSPVAFADVQAVKPKPDKEKEENLNSVEFWIEPIFVEGDHKAVTKLIDSYHIQKVSNGVFYTVVAQMADDDRLQIREFGLEALSATPSAQSFSQLTGMKHNDAEPELRTAAGRQIASYTDVTKLGFVVSALRSSESSPQVAIEAMRTLTDSTVKYSELQAQQGEHPAQKPVDVTVLEPRYTRALEVIEQQNYANSSDATVKTEATKTVAALNKFITI